MSQALAQSGSTYAFSHLGESDYLLITFNEMGSSKAFDGQSYWGRTFIEKNAINAIGIVASRPAWFPFREMEAIGPAVRERAGQFRTVVCYGFSMGAYAAIKFSRMVGATHVLAFSPQFSIDPEIVGSFDKRFLSHFDGTGGLPIGTGDASGEITVVYDPYLAVDKTNVDLIERATGRLQRIHAFNLNHTTIAPMASSRVVLDVIGAAIDRRYDDIRNIIRRRRREVPKYYFILALNATERHPRAVLKALERPEVREAIGAAASCYIGVKAAVAARDVGTARISAGQLFDMRLRFGAYHKKVIGELLRGKQRASALSLFNGARQDPKNPFWVDTQQKMARVTERYSSITDM